MWAFAKQELRSLVTPTLILAIFMLLLNGKITGLKHEINTVVQVQCVAGQSAAVIAKYNDSLDTQIDAQHQAYKLNRASGEAAKASLNMATAARLEADKIVLPPQDCSKPLLP